MLERRGCAGLVALVVVGFSRQISQYTRLDTELLPYYCLVRAEIILYGGAFAGVAEADEGFSGVAGEGDWGERADGLQLGAFELGASGLGDDGASGLVVWPAAASALGVRMMYYYRCRWCGMEINLGTMNHADSCRGRVSRVIPGPGPAPRLGCDPADDGDGPGVAAGDAGELGQGAVKLHEDLGIASDASPAEVRKAYRKKAKETHPDGGGDAEAFKRVSHAAAVLSDPQRREHYERTGDDGQSSQVDRIREQALSMVASFVAQSLADANAGSSDVRTNAVNLIRRKVQELKAQAARAEQTAKTIERNRKRWKLKAGAKDDVLAAVIVAAMRDVELTKAKLAEQVEVHTRAADMLDGYEYQFEAPPGVAPQWADAATLNSLFSRYSR